MPMTAGFFNAVICWLDDQLTALKECFDSLTAENIGGGVGLFSALVDKSFQFRTLATSKGLSVSAAGDVVTITQSVVCSYSDADPVIAAGTLPTYCVSTILIDDCTDPANPVAYYWSTKEDAYLPLTPAADANQLPTCAAHPAQTAVIGTAFTYDASETDPDGDTLTYAATGTWPAGFVIDATTGEISATAAFTAPAGVYSLNWAIDDGSGTLVPCVLSLTVSAATSAQTIQVGCESDELLPEPMVYSGVGDIPNSSPVITIGSGAPSFCGGVNLVRLMVSDMGDLYLDFDAALPATATQITINTTSIALTGGASSYVFGGNIPLHGELCGSTSATVEVDC